MRNLVLFKILLLIACLIISFRIVYINSSLNTAIHEQSAPFDHYNNDPLKDSAENRRNYIDTKMTVEKRIAELEKTRLPNWYGYIPFILSLLGGWLIKDIRRSVFKK